MTAASAPGADAPGGAVDGLLQPLRSGGGAAYLGEAVTQRDHALQAAALAERDGAGAALVAAALLHDVGWLVGGTEGDHAGLAAAWLSPRFGPEVTEPVRLHVAAKRWLCSTSAGYVDRLSAESRRTLALQGGVLDADGVAAFEAEPWAEDAVRLRRWDDDAKVPGAVVAGLEHWRVLLATVTR